MGVQTFDWGRAPFPHSHRTAPDARTRRFVREYQRIRVYSRVSIIVPPWKPGAPSPHRADLELATVLPFGPAFTCTQEDNNRCPFALRRRRSNELRPA